MTTWHDDEALADVLFFSLMSAWPDEKYQDDCGSMVGMAIGSSAWASEMRTAFSNPRSFIRNQL
jgi:hypothetical protein